jgi:hypothetical protein
MKTNKLVLFAGLGIVIGSLVYMSNFKPSRSLHAGIGGTWSSDMKVLPMDSANPELLAQLVKSAQISDEQRNALQSQYLSHLILRKSAEYGSVNVRVVSEAVSQAIAEGVINASQVEN